MSELVKGKIIILNGVSSAGKSTLAKTLQDRLSTPYFHMDVDVFCLMAPEKFGIDGNYSVQWEFVSNMFHAVKLFSDMGFNLVVPCIFLEYDENADFLKKCVTLLHSYPVLFAHVKCPIEELRRRENKRGDRKIGDSEDMLSALVPKDIYDIEVDTYNFSVEECADKIIELLDYPEKLTAFKTLWSLHTK
jgi:Chloramphenicol 3-O-phosphotransferase